MAKEMVNHPSHYNSHPAGIECIDVIRHYVCDIANALKYLWRAGLKQELGKDDASKEIEDLKKALWYIEDYRSHTRSWKVVTGMYEMVFKATGSRISHITQGYDKHIREAMQNLLLVGLVYENSVVSAAHPKALLDDATRAIQQRILAIEKQLVQHEVSETLDVLHGVIRPIKPACRRDTEPENYDPQNLIIIQGEVYCLTDEVRKSITGCMANPCDVCAFNDICGNDDDSGKMLCLQLHHSADNEYYRSVGRADYRPCNGSIEVVDEHKEMDKEMRELEEDTDFTD